MTENISTPGKSKPLKIGCLNVCGIKNRLNYQEFTDMIECYDLFCCNETMLSDLDIIRLDNYTFLSQTRKQKYLKKSGGIGIFINNKMVKYFELLETQSDYIMWVKAKKGSLSTDKDVVLGIIYIPPETSRFFNNDEMLIFENEVNDMCNSYDNIILAGDTNGHTSNLCDFIESDDFISDLFNFDNEILDFFNQIKNLQSDKFLLNRATVDTRTNTVGNTIL